MAHSPDDIRALRKRLRLTQEKLARRLDISYQTVVRWEQGRSRPSAMAEYRLGLLDRAEAA